MRTVIVVNFLRLFRRYILEVAEALEIEVVEALEVEVVEAVEIEVLETLGAVVMLEAPASEGGVELSALVASGRGTGHSAGISSGLDTVTGCLGRRES